MTIDLLVIVAIAGKKRPDQSRTRQAKDVRPIRLSFCLPHTRRDL
jgi:hypothetical protein